MNYLNTYASAGSELSSITTAMSGVFDAVKGSGVTIVIGAITLGVIFIGGKWLWGKTKSWLAQV